MHTHSFSTFILFSVWLLTEAITLSFFPATLNSSPLPGSRGEPRGARAGPPSATAPEGSGEAPKGSQVWMEDQPPAPLGLVFRNQDTEGNSPLHQRHHGGACKAPFSRDFQVRQAWSDGSFFLYIVSGIPSFMAAYLANVKR